MHWPRGSGRGPLPTPASPRAWRCVGAAAPLPAETLNFIHAPVRSGRRAALRWTSSAGGADHGVMGAIVGRDAESSAIEAFLDRSAAGPRALVIDGAAGIGKSTLWMGAVAGARDPAVAGVPPRPRPGARPPAR